MSKAMTISRDPSWIYFLYTLRLYFSKYFTYLCYVNYSRPLQDPQAKCVLLKHFKHWPIKGYFVISIKYNRRTKIRDMY